MLALEDLTKTTSSWLLDPLKYVDIKADGTSTPSSPHRRSLLGGRPKRATEPFRSDIPDEATTYRP